jgi:lipopolysaccharide export system protein LptA
MNRSKTLKRAGAAGLAALALAIGGARAQIRGDAPVEVAADEIEGLNSQGLLIYRGNVEAVQNTSRLRCSVLRIQFARRAGGQGFGDAERYICEGPVWYVTPREVARGANAVFEVASNTITMTGDVVLRQDQNVATGDKLTVNTVTNDSRLEANRPGSGPNRVRSVLYPDSAPGQQQGQPAAGR